MKETKIIAVSSQKGGACKSTTTMAVGSILARKGYKVLLIDMDAQASLTESMFDETFQESIYTAMTGKSPLPIIPANENLSVVPSIIDFSTIDVELSRKLSRETVLKKLLKPLQSQFDFILLDCAPSLGLGTINALTAATHVLIPVVAEILPLNALGYILDAINKIREELNPDLEISGILLARWENVNVSKAVEAGLRQQYGDLVFKTKIRKNTTVASAPAHKMDIIAYSPNSNGARDYTAFVEELLTTLNT